MCIPRCCYGGLNGLLTVAVWRFYLYLSIMWLTKVHVRQLQNYINVGVSGKRFILKKGNIQTLMKFLPLALYFYDYFLSLQWQIRCFWTRGFSHVSFLLYLNCYLNCVVCVMTVVGLPGIIVIGKG